MAFYHCDRVGELRILRLAADRLSVGQSTHQEFSLLFDLCLTSYVPYFSHKNIKVDQVFDLVDYLVHQGPALVYSQPALG